MGPRRPNLLPALTRLATCSVALGEPLRGTADGRYLARLVEDPERSVAD